MQAEKQDDIPVNTVWMHERDLAEYLHMPLSAIVRKRRAGKWAPHVKVGAQVIYSKATVNAWLAEQQTSSVSHE